jgi:hypothetical protein
LYHVNATFTSWAQHCINTSWLANVASIALAINTSFEVPQTLKQTTQYNKYCICLVIGQCCIHSIMGLVKIYLPWIISESWYCIRRPIFLCKIILFDVNFQ